VTFASDAMTPQRINGFVAAWNGQTGTISVSQSQVPVSCEPHVFHADLTATVAS
jgi:hypothetical protein